MPLRPETRDMFMKAVEALRAAGAEVIVGDSILPTSFARTASRVATYAYMKDGTDRFLATFGPTQYHSADEYLKVAGAPLFTSSIGTEDNFRNIGDVHIEQRRLADDPNAERLYHAPRRAVLGEYVATLDRMKLDGFVYPAIQMPPPDETMPQDGRVSEGPHSATSWINMMSTQRPIAVIMVAGRVCKCGLGSRFLRWSGMADIPRMTSSKRPADIRNIKWRRLIQCRSALLSEQGKCCNHKDL